MVLASGLDMMFPMEPGSGMDVVEIRKTYGDRLALQGGIDKYVLREGEDAIDRELAYKTQPSMWPGTIYALDHRVPNGTTIQQYRHFVRKTQELIGAPVYQG